MRRGGQAILVVLFLSAVATGQQRFSVPTEFDTGYEKPSTDFPSAQPDVMQYVDIAALAVALGASAFLALRLRSRRGLFVLMLLSLVYFGFWRGGCVCPIGAIQNVTLAIFDSGYTVPLAILVFFMLPLVFTLLFGRSFCAAVCPLGAVQDVVLIRPVKVPSWLAQALELLAYAYLGLAVLLAATGSAFIICQYDPFVSLFRLIPVGRWAESLARKEMPGGTFGIVGRTDLLILLGSFLIISAFVGRPYCRFLCPYSVILRLLSRVSRWRVTITPDECIQCRLCEDSCPFGAIQQPTVSTAHERRQGAGRLALLLVLLPVLIAVGGWLGSMSAPALSQAHPTVQLAEQVWLEETGKIERSEDANDPANIFRETATPLRQLYAEAATLKGRFTIGGWLLGGFLGLAVGGRLVRLAVRKRRTDYEANRATCLSCGRCFKYCPRERARRKRPADKDEAALINA